MHDLLQENIVSPQVRDAQNETPLHYAAREARVNIVKILKEFGASNFVHNASFETPHIVAGQGLLKNSEKKEAYAQVIALLNPRTKRSC